jgi:hypothetical protein
MAAACLSAVGNAPLPLAHRSVSRNVIHPDANRAAQRILRVVRSNAKSHRVPLYAQTLAAPTSALSAKQSVGHLCAHWPAHNAKLVIRSARRLLASGIAKLQIFAQSLNARWYATLQSPARTCQFLRICQSWPPARQWSIRSVRNTQRVH